MTILVFDKLFSSTRQHLSSHLVDALIFPGNDGLHLLQGRPMPVCHTGCNHSPSSVKSSTSFPSVESSTSYPSVKSSTSFPSVESSTVIHRLSISAVIRNKTNAFQLRTMSIDFNRLRTERWHWQQRTQVISSSSF